MFSSLKATEVTSRSGGTLEPRSHVVMSHATRALYAEARQVRSALSSRHTEAWCAIKLTRFW